MRQIKKFYSCDVTLNEILDVVREFKLQNPDAMDKDFQIDISYENCYYAGDYPDLVINYLD